MVGAKELPHCWWGGGSIQRASRHISSAYRGFFQPRRGHPAQRQNLSTPGRGDRHTRRAFSSYTTSAINSSIERLFWLEQAEQTDYVHQMTQGPSAFEKAKEETGGVSVHPLLLWTTPRQTEHASCWPSLCKKNLPSSGPGCTEVFFTPCVMK